jgi:hypothetical protein
VRCDRERDATWGRGVQHRGAGLESAISEGGRELVQGGPKANTSYQGHMLTHRDRVEPVAEGELGNAHGLDRININLEGVLLGQHHALLERLTVLYNWRAVRHPAIALPSHQHQQVLKDKGPLAWRVRGRVQ